MVRKTNNLHGGHWPLNSEEISVQEKDGLRRMSESFESKKDEYVKSLMKTLEEDPKSFLGMVTISLDGLSVSKTSSRDSQSERPFDECSIASSCNRSHQTTATSKPFDECYIKSNDFNVAQDRKMEYFFDDTCNRSNQSTTTSNPFDEYSIESRNSSSRNRSHSFEETREEPQDQTREHTLDRDECAPEERKISIQSVPCSMIEYISDTTKKPMSVGPSLYEKIHSQQQPQSPCHSKCILRTSTSSTFQSGAHSIYSSDLGNIRKISSMDDSVDLSKKDSPTHFMSPYSTTLKEKASIDSENTAVEPTHPLSLTNRSTSTECTVTKTTNENESRNNSFRAKPQILSNCEVASPSPLKMSSQPPGVLDKSHSSTRISENITMKDIPETEVVFSKQQRALIRKANETSEKDRKLRECYSTIQALTVQLKNSLASRSQSSSLRLDLPEKQHQKEISKLREELSRKNLALSEKEQKLEECYSTIDSLKNQPESASNNDLEAKYSKLKQVFDQLEARNKELEDESWMNDTFELKYQMLESKYEDLKESFSNTIESQKTQYPDDEARSEKLERKCFDLESRLSELQEKYAALEAQNRELRSNKNSKINTEERYKTLQKQHDELTESFARLDLHYRQLKSKEDANKHFEQKCQLLETQNNELTAYCNRLEDQKKELSEANEVLEPRFRELNSQHTELRESFSTLEGRFLGEKGAKEELDQRCQALEEKYLELHGKLLELENSNNKLMDSNELLKAQNETLRKRSKAQSDTITKRLDDLKKEDLYTMGTQSIKLLQLGSEKHSITASWSHEINLSNSSTETDLDKEHRGEDDRFKPTFEEDQEAEARNNSQIWIADIEQKSTDAENDLLNYFEQVERGLIKEMIHHDYNDTDLAMEQAPKETVESPAHVHHSERSLSKKQPQVQVPTTHSSARPPLSPRPPLSSSPPSISSQWSRDQQHAVSNQSQTNQSLPISQHTAEHKSYNRREGANTDTPSTEKSVGSSNERISKENSLQDKLTNQIVEGASDQLPSSCLFTHLCSTEDPRVIPEDAHLLDDQIIKNGAVVPYNTQLKRASPERSLAQRLQVEISGEDIDIHAESSLFENISLSPSSTKAKDCLNNSPPQHEEQLLVVRKPRKGRKKSCRACDCFVPFEFDPPQRHEDDDDGNSIVEDGENKFVGSSAKDLHCDTSCGMNAFQEAIHEQLPGSCTSTLARSPWFTLPHSEQSILLSGTVTTTPTLRNGDTSFDSINSESGGSTSSCRYQGSRSLLAKRDKLRRKQMQALSASSSSSGGVGSDSGKETPRQRNSSRAREQSFPSVELALF